MLIFRQTFLNQKKIMKKNLLLAAVASFVMTSCVKDYTCTCTYTPSGSSSQQQHSYDMKDIKKSNAQSTCNALGADAIAQGGTCTYK